MVSHTQDTIWPCHWQRVYKMLVDFPLRHPEQWLRAHPDLADCEVQFDEEQGNIRHYMVEFHAATEIPAVLQSVVKPSMLNWVQEGWWDHETLTCRQRNIPNFLKEYCDIQNEWRLSPVSDTETREVWTCYAKCTIPVLGGMIANAILSRGVASRQRTMEIYFQQLREDAV